jgi:hypothetical protein
LKGGKKMMVHKGCNGNILFEFSQVCFIGMNLNAEGDIDDVQYDEPGSEINNERYECQFCGKTWSTKEEMLAANQ